MTRTELISYIEKIIAEGPFSASWDSLEEYCPPKWLNESKLGIFIHWGVYSVPATILFIEGKEYIKEAGIFSIHTLNEKINRLYEMIYK